LGGANLLFTKWFSITACLEGAVGNFSRKGRIGILLRAIETTPVFRA